MLTDKRKTITISLALLFCSLLAIYKVVLPNDMYINENFFKDNPDFVYKKEGKNLMICRNDFYTEELASLLLNPEKPFTIKKKWIKKSIDRSIITWSVEGKKFVIKKHSANNSWHILKQVFFRHSSKALRSFYYSYLFDKMEINTPKAVAIIEKRIGPFHVEAYHIMEHIKGVKGTEYFAQPFETADEKRESIKQTLRIAQKLDNAKIIHGNLNLSHVHYVDGKPYILDLDITHKYSNKSLRYKPRQKKCDYKHLYTGLEDSLTPHEHCLLKEESL